MSRVVVEPAADQVHAVGVRDLLVLWQHPETREIIPIGRLAYDGREFTFSYTRAVIDIEHFRPLPGLNGLTTFYRSEFLPSVFANRVMHSSRPDFGEYVRAMGLEPEEATPWEQIVQSGGDRAGDTLQFIPVPTVEASRARARFLVNGVRWVPDHVFTLDRGEVTVTSDEHEDVLRGLRSSMSVDLEPELDNPVDPDATLVTVDGTPLGWVPRALSTDARRLLDLGRVRGTVLRVGSADGPPHLRLAVNVDTPVTPHFAFDRENRWEPISSG